MSLVVAMAILAYSQQAPLQGYYQWLQAQGVAACVMRGQSAQQGPPLPQAPGSGIYSQGGDTLRYSVWSSGGAHTVQFGGQMQTFGGEWKLFGERIVTGDTTNFKVVTRPALAGWYTNAVGSIDPSETVYPPGVWCRVELCRMNNGNLLPFALLFQGYISSQAVAAMNAGSAATDGGSGGGGGCCPTNMWDDIGTGGGPTETYNVGVTPGVSTRLIFLALNLTTSGTAGNRLVTLQLLPTSGFGFEDRAVAVQAAGTTVGYVWQLGGQRYVMAGSTEQYMGLPDDMWFDRDFQVLVSINGVKAGDAFDTGDFTFQDK